MDRDHSPGLDPLPDLADFEHDDEYRQAVTGFGCMAALRAERWLESSRATSID